MSVKRFIVKIINLIFNQIFYYLKSNKNNLYIMDKELKEFIIQNEKFLLEN